MDALIRSLADVHPSDDADNNDEVDDDGDGDDGGGGDDGDGGGDDDGDDAGLALQPTLHADLMLSRR